MSVVSKIRDKVQAPVLVQCVVGVAGNDFSCDPRCYYLLPAGHAAELIKANIVRPVTDPLEVNLAKMEIEERMQCQ